jgi:hypothetical protein
MGEQASLTSILIPVIHPNSKFGIQTLNISNVQLKWLPFRLQILKKSSVSDSLERTPNLLHHLGSVDGDRVSETRWLCFDLKEGVCNGKRRVFVGIIAVPDLPRPPMSLAASFIPAVAILHIC